MATALYTKAAPPPFAEHIPADWPTVDPLEAPRPIGVLVHVEVPIYGWAPWASYNILVVNPATYQAAWDAYLDRFDRVLYLDATTTPEAIVEAVKAVKAEPPAQALPPLLSPNACPNISIVTLLHNRRKFFDLACHSIMISDYPLEKIEWVVVEDSDDPNEDASDLVVAVAEKSKTVKIVYVPLGKKTAIGKKRNIGVERASNNIILMMDDDDHYPETSFRRRVAWLINHVWGAKAVCATTIACYDLVKGVSAVNVPAFGLPLGKRLSEATLTFYKTWWTEKGFPEDVQVGEGDGFVAGREKDVLEIPPQQAIVAFGHSKNVSSRRVLSDTDVTPGCFWGFPKEFLVFAHGLAGIKVVE
jgi:hypothetical protein